MLNAYNSPLDMIMLLSHPEFMLFWKIFQVSDSSVEDVSHFTGILRISSFVLQQRIRFRQRMYVVLICLFVFCMICSEPGNSLI